MNISKQSMIDINQGNLSLKIGGIKEYMCSLSCQHIENSNFEYMILIHLQKMSITVDFGIDLIDERSSKQQ